MATRGQRCAKSGGGTRATENSPHQVCEGLGPEPEFVDGDGRLLGVKSIERTLDTRPRTGPARLYSWRELTGRLVAQIVENAQGS